MIPKIDPAYRKEIRVAVREKAGRNSGSSSELIGSLIRLHIERTMHRLGLENESKLLCAALIFVLAFPLAGIAVALHRLAIWLLEFDAASISHRDEVPALLALNSTIAFGFVMFIFALGISAKRHKTSLFYPREDDSLKRYISTRTRAGLLTVFVISLASYAIAAFKLDTVPLNILWAICHATLQSLFLVSTAIIFARYIQPRFGESTSNSFGFIAMVLYALITVAYLSAPERSTDESLFLLCSPHVWTNTTVYFLSVTPHPIGWVLLVTIGIVIGKGIQSYFELRNMQPANSLDGDQPTVDEDVICESINVVEKSTEASVLKRIQGYDHQPTGRFEIVSAMLFPRSKLQPRKLPARPSAADSGRIKPVWERGCELVLLLLAVVLVSGLAGAVFGWLASAYYYQIQSSAMLLCAAILLIPWLATLRLFGTHVSSRLYPVGIVSFSTIVCATWLRSFCFILPVVVVLIAAFCFRFELIGLEVFWFVFRPVAFAVGLVPVSIAMQFSYMSGRSDMRIAMLVGWALFLLVALISSLMMLVAPERDLGADAIVVSQIATGVWLSATFGYSIACFALQHFGNWDVSDEVLRMRNHGINLNS